MNCLTARQTLDLARPDEPQTNQPETSEFPAHDPRSHDPGADECASADGSRTPVEAAARHVEECPACQTAMLGLRQFDRKVSVMIRAAPVPLDLKDRLLAQLEAAAGVEEDVDSGATAVAAAPAVGPGVSTPAPVAATPGSSPARSRRHWLGSAALAAACVAAGVGTWSLWPVAPSISPDKVAERLATDGIGPGDFAEFIRFAGGLDAKVADTMKANRLVLPPRRLDELDVAVYFFAFSARGPVDGRLAVIPRRLVVAREMPQASSFLAPPETVAYKGGYCITAWTEGKFVYICCLKGGEDELRRLLPHRAPPT